MAKKLKVGDSIRGYKVTRIFGPGAMAISYAAQSPSGQRIFLKQYKSPAPTVVWYRAYVDYQQEVANRVRTGKAANYAVRLVDAFEEVWGGPCYFQAYEFVEHGGDLEKIFEQEREQQRASGARSIFADPKLWERHVTWAKVFMAGIAALHESQVVHADLKPPNVFLLRDESLGAGYQLKLIDMDFSVLADRKPPWHGHQGYVGTDNYRSPEHMTRGAVPGLASDIFTCGLILYELLAGQHPYWTDDQAEYARRAQAYEAKPPVLGGAMPGDADDARVAQALHRCLSPKPADRPTAAELRAVLAGRESRASTTAATAKTPAPAAPATAPAAAGKAAKPAAPAAPAAAPIAATAPAKSGTVRLPIGSQRVQLVDASGKMLQVGVRTELGKRLLRQFGADAEFWDDRQAILERASTGQWHLSPVAGTTNETLLNGEVLAASQPLHEGDVVAVGRRAKGVVKMPLTLRAL